MTDHRWVPIRLCAGPQSDEASGGMGSEGSVQLVLHFIPLHPHPAKSMLTAQPQRQEMMSP